MKIVRPLMMLALVSGGVVGASKVLGRSRQQPEVTEPPWPTQRLVAAPSVAASPAAGSPSSAWVEPVDGACPISHPIKGNDSSKIFHLPGGRSYDRTKPERCYASADAALADGYRAAKA